MTEPAAEDLGQVMADEHESLSELFHRVTSPEEEDRGAVLAELIRELAAHASIEDSLVAPVVRQRLDGGTQLARQLRADSRDTQKLLVRIERRKPNSPDQPALVGRLGDVFDRHCRLWADAVQPGIDADVPAEERSALRDEIVSARALIVSHPHPHLLALGPVSRLTSRLAGRWDWLRDTVSGRRMALGEQRHPGEPSH